MIDVTTENFEAEVIHASMSQPVLIDFWAPWCGPCKVIGPILEKLEAEYAGRFSLVKINSDDEQQLAAAFGIRSIPTCILMMDGKPVDGFMGALPERQLREFLDKHLPGEEALLAQAEAEEAQDHLASGDVESALARLSEALAKDPANDDLRFDYARLLISTRQLERAAAIVAPALSRIPAGLRFEALQQWLNALEFVAKNPRGAWALAEFDEKIKANPRDFDTRYAKARVLMAGDAWTEALDELLEIILRDKKWGEEGPRKTYVAILELLTPPKPKAGPQDSAKSPGGIELASKSLVQEEGQAAVVSAYRRRLSMALN